MQFKTIKMNQNSNKDEECISFEEFSKIEIKVGKITKIENIPRKDRVYLAEVDIGSEIRQVIVGAALYYSAEELVDRIVIVCTNLCPKKVGNINSNGMILAAEGHGGKPVFLTIDGNNECEVGSTIH